MIYCRKCGKALSDDAVFCSECGTAVKRIEQPVVHPVIQESKPKFRHKKALIVAIIVSALSLSAAVALLLLSQKPAEKSVSSGMPDWYIVNQVAVKGNEFCFSRDDGLILDDEVEPLTVTHYIFDDNGNLISVKEYIVLENEDMAIRYVNELNTYDSDGRNSFGMQKGWARYYNVGNILIEELLPEYTNENVGTMSQELGIFDQNGWKISYIQ